MNTTQNYADSITEKGKYFIQLTFYHISPLFVYTPEQYALLWEKSDIEARESEAFRKACRYDHFMGQVPPQLIPEMHEAIQKSDEVIAEKAKFFSGPYADLEKALFDYFHVPDYCPFRHELYILASIRLDNLITQSISLSQEIQTLNRKILTELYCCPRPHIISQLKAELAEAEAKKLKCDTDTTELRTRWDEHHRYLGQNTISQFPVNPELVKKIKITSLNSSTYADVLRVDLTRQKANPIWEF